MPMDKKELLCILRKAPRLQVELRKTVVGERSFQCLEFTVEKRDMVQRYRFYHEDGKVATRVLASATLSKADVQELKSEVMSLKSGHVRVLLEHDKVTAEEARALWW